RQQNGSHDASDRDEHRKRQDSARRVLVETKSSGAADDPIREDTIDFVERVGMNDRIGVDEREDLTLGDARTAIARSGNRALLDERYPRTASARECRSAIGGGVIRDDDFDCLDTAAIVPARDVDALQEPGQQPLLVVGGYDQRKARLQRSAAFTGQRRPVHRFAAYRPAARSESSAAGGPAGK